MHTTTTSRKLSLMVSICCLVLLLSTCSQGNAPSPPITTTTVESTTTVTVQTVLPTSVSSAYPSVDGISCDQLERLAFHIHAHISIYINGNLAVIPQNVGIASDFSCLYWLHTHDTSGVIHMEAPSTHSFILGNFLDEWKSRFGQLSYPSELDSAARQWQAYVDGKLFTGDFRSIPLNQHTLITLAYHSPGVQPDTTYNWGSL